MGAGKAVVAFGCVYELAALPDRSPLPTITAIVKRPRRHPFGYVVTGLSTLITLVHFWPHPPHHPASR